MNEQPDNRLLTVFAPFPRFVLPRTRTALIVVDMQYADADPNWGIGRAAGLAGDAAAFAEYWPAVSRAVACQRRLLDAAHRQRVQVIFTRRRAMGAMSAASTAWLACRSHATVAMPACWMSCRWARHNAQA